MRNYKEEIKEMGNYMLQHDSFQLLPAKECALLTYLVDAEDYCKRIEKEKLGEEVFSDFYQDEFDYEAAFHNFVEKKLIAWSKREYRNNLERLRDKGYVFLERKNGDNTKPYIVTLNYEALDTLAEIWKYIDIIYSYKPDSRNFYSMKKFNMPFKDILKLAKDSHYEVLKPYVIHK